MLLQTVSNHPAHILNHEGNFSPSSFIPFCAFGEKFIGSQIKDFDIPVCNIFKARNYFDQLCYETDLQDLKDINKVNLKNQLELGLTLVLDYNEERQLNHNNIDNSILYSMKAFYQNEGSSVSIHLDTIGTFLALKVFMSVCLVHLSRFSFKNCFINRSC